MEIALKCHLKRNDINNWKYTKNKTRRIEKLPMMPGNVERTYANISKAKELIGYVPKTSFEEGVKKYIKWYKENI